MNELQKLLGPFPQKVDLNAEVLEYEDCGSYVREKVAYNTEESERIGFIGHSYGGRMALWVPAFDSRIKASVSSCGCVPYRHSLTHDAGIQMEFCIPGIMQKLDIDDVIKSFKDCALLISATTGDKWSRGATELYGSIKGSFHTEELELKLYEGKHVFTPEMREYAYSFLERKLKA